jgi:hypothetical protein
MVSANKAIVATAGREVVRHTDVDAIVAAAVQTRRAPPSAAVVPTAASTVVPSEAVVAEAVVRAAVVVGVALRAISAAAIPLLVLVLVVIFLSAGALTERADRSGERSAESEAQRATPGCLIAQAIHQYRQPIE